MVGNAVCITMQFVIWFDLSTCVSQVGLFSHESKLYNFNDHDCILDRVYANLHREPSFDLRKRCKFAYTRSKVPSIE